MSVLRRIAEPLRWRMPADGSAALVGLGMQLLQIALGLLSTPLLLDHLGKARYSQLAILWALVFFTPLLDLGLPRVVARLGTRLPEGERGDEAVAALRSSLRAQLGVIGCATVAILLAALAGEPGAGFSGEAGRAFVAFCGVLGCLLLHNLMIAHLQGRGWLHRMTLIQSIAGLLTAAVPLLLLRFTLDLGGLALAFLAVRGVALGAALLVVRAGEGLRWREFLAGATLRIASLLREGSQGIVYFALAPLVVYGERYLIPALSGLHSFSAHLIAVDVGLRFLFVPGLISQYAFRSVAQGLSGRSAIDGVFPAYFALVGPLFVLPLVAAILFGNELVHAWLGAQADALTVLCVRIVALALGACSVSALLVQASIAAARTAALSRMAVVEVVLYLGAVALGALLLETPAAITLMASALWSLRLLINSGVIVQIARRTLGAAGLWRLLAAAALPGFAAMAAAGLFEALLRGPALWGAKVALFVLLALSWWRGMRRWALRPVAA